MDDATSYPSISPTATSEESTLTRIPGADFQTREISTAPGLFRVLSNSDNSNGGYPPSIMYSARAVRTDNHSTVPTSHICPEDSSSEAVEEQIDEIAEVTQFVTSPSISDHIPVLGARAWESKHEGGTCQEAFFVVSPAPYAPNTV